MMPTAGSSPNYKVPFEHQQHENNMTQTLIPDHRNNSYFSSNMEINSMDQAAYNQTTGQVVADTSPSSFVPGSEFQAQLQYAQYQESNSYLQPTSLDAPSSAAALAGSMSPSTMNDSYSPASYNQATHYNSPNPESSIADTPFPSLMGFSTMDPFSINLEQPQEQDAMSYFSPNPMATAAFQSTSPINQIRSSPANSHSPAVPYSYPMTGDQMSSNGFTSPAPQPPHQAPLSSISKQAGASHSKIYVQTQQRPSPVVRVENYSDDGPEGFQGTSKRGRVTSSAHLSPFPHDVESSDEEDEESPRGHTAPSIGRHADGSWKGGVAPGDRHRLDNQEILSVDELDEKRQINERNFQVAEWLSHSEAEGKKPRKKRVKSRPRAKSANDIPFSNALMLNYDSSAFRFDDSLIPGPGAYINVPSELDESDVDGDGSEADTEAEVEIPEDVDPNLRSLPDNVVSASQSSAWETPASGDSNAATHPPPRMTSNLAIERFRERAKEMDNTSLAATVGSRRRSESDLGSIYAAAGIAKLLLEPSDRTRVAHVRRKSSNILSSLLPHRNNSNKLKRKGSDANAQQDSPASPHSPAEAQTSSVVPKRNSSFGKHKTPKVQVNTNVPPASSEGRSPIFNHLKIKMSRSRSKSDVKSPKSTGLTALWTQVGGPPMPLLASPSQARVHPQRTCANDADDDSSDEATVGPDGVVMDLSVRTDMHIEPTIEGFTRQVKELNPRIKDFLLQRIVEEQVKRYKRLVEARAKHTNAAAKGRCTHKNHCFSSGGTSKPLSARPSNKGAENAPIGFVIVPPGTTPGGAEFPPDDQTTIAHFPSGVPVPPVNRLPAEFECQICFVVKKFYKPSDWTKHVHEDVQPFTCTFPNCTEPKSFKRKADWVRHENERHRQLEYWQCNRGECSHICFRKDNFVQHLVREHKVPDPPKVRMPRSGGAKSPETPALDTMAAPGQWNFSFGPAMTQRAEVTGDEIWALVDECHKEAPKSPKDEPCKFCDNICPTWKKLTVHLAKHMEQISMPVLALVDQTLGFPIAPRTHVSATKPPNDVPTFIYDEPGELNFTGMGSSNMAAPVMHSYPPPSVNFQTQISLQQSSLTPTTMSYAQAYLPAPSSRARASSFNDVDRLRQGTTYPPAVHPSRVAQSSTSMAYDQQPQMFFQSATNFMQDPMGDMSAAFLVSSNGGSGAMGYVSKGNVLHGNGQPHSAGGMGMDQQRYRF
ncbi:hypothetical protein EJ06DRAFT_428369 [Trichodelitschia bisporula]|uniref:C2H2-type domain-containing protein n=1 Tax=Trichodelitschia bisporula TaxID=703511 RepID=A0A6G1HWT9_9PEZI|nr:hypothetical protein EJ06DRAFT_428369 [Trichodelitschia bisporula]